MKKLVFNLAFILLANTIVSAQEVEIRLKLRDESVVIGKTVLTFLNLKTKNGKQQIPVKEIDSVRIGLTPKKDIISTSNGDLIGTLDIDKIKATTEFGELDILKGKIAEFELYGSECENKKSISGQWQFSEIKSASFDKQVEAFKILADTTTDEAMKAMYISYLVETIPNMLEEMKKTVLEYHNNGKYKATLTALGQDTVMNGQWKLSCDCKKLISFDEKGKRDSANIQSITSEKLVIVSMPETAEEATIFLIKKEN